ncbi:hypothetical protein AKJ37_02045 [candidate division MSBL1 archaeon SCGC-AAA259I09]|uniref:DNA polymerase II small subunit n=3 Tax=candidate division MSBL1 TaxID=215777 RepID=A0A133UUR9_9EURY|nr:hypothetical protein AKJ61_01385 [candidate division MSBL1 archaeon SCGC-AAA259B11]KXA93711.1 hypothetical protein AKJ66_01320 [candidate division MSBL1 archaeon SCGC-AAA259E22]KXA97899.1 hypothetical protein AKJ37_02045 [candidate division MSBL1 archaeon SCGC-AAA259I09]
MHVTPDALDRISNSSETVISRILSELEGREDRPSIVTDRVVSQILESEEVIPSSVSTPSTEGEEDAESELAEDETLPQIEADASEEVVLGEDGDTKLRNFRDITGNSSSEGKVEDFVQLFRDRYEKLSSIVLSREGFQNYTEMRNIVRHEGDMVNLVGLVNEKRETRKKDAWIVELEDPTGKAVIYVKDSKRNERVVEKIKRIVTDEVVGVKAKVPDEMRSGSRNPLVWGNEIVWPDVPISQSSSTQDRLGEASGYAVLISDIHVGSSMFMSEVFNKFLDWLNGNAGNKKQKELAKQVKYLLIAGDLVDGIGIYPGQQKELEIENVHEQYKKVAELLSRVPDHITVIAAPGNHDAVRLAEPQPALGTEIAAPLRKINMKLVGNPALLSIEGVKFLIYHGMSFDDLISAVPDLDRENVALPMREILKRRHLAPIYGEPMGGRTPIAPENEDYLVIDELPDVLHCGHLHRYDCDEYRGVLMVNSATFQKQTLFMKRQGVTPTPGHVPIVNLETREVRAINFA